MKQAGGVAAPVGGQILSEVLPYLELQKDNITEEIIQVEVPEFRNKTVKEAKDMAKELEIEIEINGNNQENINDKVISNQIPLPGIKINNDTKIYLDLEE